ncbi:hypothetical protein Tsubulata_012252 [Turnera subulata]|uniref:Uncharacterized protein n=1 Tax=Turnera subulata TaxID=218843 RepID=A0A9Q0GC48_9ROSI|nr:hypothetical protein Tsubulata_012252 [Turnera subulata]
MPKPSQASLFKLLLRSRSLIPPRPGLKSCVKSVGKPGFRGLSLGLSGLSLLGAVAQPPAQPALVSPPVAECARAAVKQVMDMFQGLLEKLPESEKAALQRSMGLKMEQLKAELQQLDD